MSRPAPYYAEVDGKKVRVPGVTTITGRFKDSGGLLYWANQVGLGEKACDDQEECTTCGRKAGKRHREAMEVAAGIGTFAHALIDEFVKGAPVVAEDFAHLDDEQHEMAHQCFETFQNWWNGADVEVLETELSLVSNTLLYGGRFDAIGLVNGKFAIMDWKTANAVYSDYLAQLAGYMLLVEEHGFPEVQEIHIIRVSKESAGFEHRSLPRRTFQPAVDYFLQARKLYDLIKPMEKLLK